MKAYKTLIQKSGKMDEFNVLTSPSGKDGIIILNTEEEIKTFETNFAEQILAKKIWNVPMDKDNMDSLFRVDAPKVEPVLDALFTNTELGLIKAKFGDDDYAIVANNVREILTFKTTPSKEASISEIKKEVGAVKEKVEEEEAKEVKEVKEAKKK